VALHLEQLEGGDRLGVFQRPAGMTLEEGVGALPLRVEHDLDVLLARLPRVAEEL